jgi:hypothetical protein
MQYIRENFKATKQGPEHASAALVIEFKMV